MASHKDANADLYYLSPVTPEGAAILVPTHHNESDTSLHNILKTRTRNDKKQPMMTSPAHNKASRRNTTLADDIDIYSRVVFPGVFAALSTLYWVVYLSISPSAATSGGEFVFI